MKKTILLLILAISLTACGNNNNDIKITETPTPTATPEPTATPTPTPEPVKTTTYEVDGIQFELNDEWVEFTTFEWEPNEVGRFGRENTARELLGPDTRRFTVSLTEKHTALETANGIKTRYKGIYEKELLLDGAVAGVLENYSDALPNLRSTIVVIIKDGALYEISYQWDIRSQAEFDALEAFIASIKIVE